MSALGLLLLAGACGGTLPSALAPDAPTPVLGAPLPPGDLEAAAELLVGADPLLRRPSASARWSELEGGAALADWAALSADPNTAAVDWFALERRWPGSLAVPLARGARLASLEVMVAGELRNEDQDRVAGLLGPLVDLDRKAAGDARSALAWTQPASAPPEALSAAVLHIAERDVLLGWLNGPAIPTGPAARAFRPGLHDRLEAMPAGALLLARGRAKIDPEAGAEGAALLELATTLALQRAAADTDAEQARVRTALAEAATALRERGLELPEAEDAALRVALAEARRALTTDAASERSLGLALVALSAERIHGSCPDAPCTGLDRVATLQRAAAWEAGAEGPARSWICVAAKEVLDTTEVTMDKPSYGLGSALLADLLLGLGSDELDLSVLRQARPGPATWLAITRATGATDGTNADAGLHALKGAVAQTCGQALALATLPAQREALDGILRRSAKP